LNEAASAKALTLERTMNNFDFEGQVAIVTGAASGLGLATAKRLLQSGAKVEVWDRNKKALSETLEALTSFGDCAALSVDVAEAEDIARAVSEVLSRRGHIDILINNAGITGPFAKCSDYPIAGWHNVLAVNLTGVFLCCRAAIPTMVERRYGRILNVASIAGKEGNPLQSAYCAAKAGVIALTKTLGKELATTGVLVNAIAPTIFDTPLAAASIDGDPQLAAAVAAKIPMQRIGRPEEFAAMATWIVSRECTFTTGFTFDVSGGRAVY
jgi:3-oxoacyl-[acyl-carrier protein] reductase